MPQLPVNRTLQSQVTGAFPACILGQLTVRYGLLLNNRFSTEVCLIGTFCSLNYEGKQGLPLTPQRHTKRCQLSCIEVVNGCRMLQTLSQEPKYWATTEPWLMGEDACTTASTKAGNLLKGV